LKEKPFEKTFSADTLSEKEAAPLSLIDEKKKNSHMPASIAGCTSRGGGGGGTKRKNTVSLLGNGKPIRTPTRALAQSARGGRGRGKKQKTIARRLVFSLKQEEKHNYPKRERPLVLGGGGRGGRKPARRFTFGAGRGKEGQVSCGIC